MAQTLAQFAQKIRSSQKYDVLKRGNEIKQVAAIAAIQTVIRATPFDTGRAKNNWIVKINSPDRNIIEQTNYDKSGGQAINKGSVIAQTSKEEESIYLSNNLPYIEPLNNGSSRQAPAGFVQIAIRAAVNAVKRSKFLR